MVKKAKKNIFLVANLWMVLWKEVTVGLWKVVESEKSGCVKSVYFESINSILI